MEFFDEGGWDETGSDLPKLLFLLENPAAENRLRRAAHAVRSRFDLDDEVEIYTATAENLLGEDSAIWSNIDELGETLSLDELWMNLRLHVRQSAVRWLQGAPSGELAVVARKPPRSF